MITSENLVSQSIQLGHTYLTKVAPSGTFLFCLWKIAERFNFLFFKETVKIFLLYLLLLFWKRKKVCLGWKVLFWRLFLQVVVRWIWIRLALVSFLFFFVNALRCVFSLNMVCWGIYSLLSNFVIAEYGWRKTELCVFLRSTVYSHSKRISVIISGKIHLVISRQQLSIWVQRGKDRKVVTLKRNRMVNKHSIPTRFLNCFAWLKILTLGLEIICFGPG